MFRLRVLVVDDGVSVLSTMSKEKTVSNEGNGGIEGNGGAKGRGEIVVGNRISTTY